MRRTHKITGLPRVSIVEKTTGRQLRCIFLLCEGNDMSACVNRDQELWREQPGDFYSNSIHVTEAGGIGINVGGKVLVAPAKRWHDAGMKMFAVDPKLSRWRWRLAMWLLG